MTDVEFARCLAEERARENSIVSLVSREAARARGVAWSGMSPEPVRRRAAAVQEADALTAAAERRAWRESAAGRLATALVEAESAAAAAWRSACAARAALSREAADPSAAAPEAERLARAARRLARAARRARHVGAASTL